MRPFVYSFSLLLLVPLSSYAAIVFDNTTAYTNTVYQSYFSDGDASFANILFDGSLFGSIGSFDVELSTLSVYHEDYQFWFNLYSGTSTGDRVVIARTSSMNRSDLGASSEFYTFSFPNVIPLAAGQGYSLELEIEPMSEWPEKIMLWATTYVTGPAMRTFQYETDTWLVDSGTRTGVLRVYDVVGSTSDGSLSFDLLLHDYETVSTATTSCSVVAPSVEYCADSVLWDAVFLDVDAVVPAGMKLEYRVTDDYGNLLSPAWVYSQATAYASTTVVDEMVPFPIPFPTASSTIQLQVCVLDVDDFATFAGDDSVCATLWYGNGMSQEQLETFVVSTGRVAQSFFDTYTDSDCDSIGTDIFKGVKCAFLWAFVPSDLSVQELRNTADSFLHMVPIGYATLMFDLMSSSSQSTSTAYLDKDIDVGAWFGRSGYATVTVDTADLVSGPESSMWRPIAEKAEDLSWFAFFGWLLAFAFTRKL